MSVSRYKSHLFSPSLKVFKLASSAKTLVGVSSKLIVGNAFAEDEDETVGVEDTYNTPIPTNNAAKNTLHDQLTSRMQQQLQKTMLTHLANYSFFQKKLSLADYRRNKMLSSMPQERRQELMALPREICTS